MFSDVLRGIYDALDGSRYSIQLANTRYSILQEERLLRLFLAQKPAGLIVTGINQTPDSRAILEQVDCPIVQIMEIGPAPVEIKGNLVSDGRGPVPYLVADLERDQHRATGFERAAEPRELSP